MHYDSQSHSQGFLSALCNNIFLGMLLISDLLISSNRGFNSKYGRVSTLEIQTKVSKVSSMFFFYVPLISITECNNKKNAQEAKSRGGILVACAYNIKKYLQLKKSAKRHE